MRIFTSSVVSLALFFTASFAMAAQTEKCTLEETTDFNTVVALAMSDYIEGMAVAANTATNASDLLQKALQLDKAYRTTIGNAAFSLSNVCLFELLTAEDNYQQCQGPLNASTMKAMEPAKLAAERYVKTGDRKSYEADIREIVRTTLQSVPRACWFQPASRPTQSTAQACPSEWSAYERCEANNKMAIVTGRGSLNNLTRKTISLCYRPACPKY